MTQVGPPHGLTLFDHAQISAAIAEGDRTMTMILEARGITEEQWLEATRYWMAKMGDDVQKNGQHAKVPIVYADAFGEAQDALRPVVEMDAASYAALVVAVQNAGGPDLPLAQRGLSSADYLRLSRRWAKVLSSDSEQSHAFFEAYQALHAPAQEGA